MWGCGLKYQDCIACSQDHKVTPYVGVWIEIFYAGLHTINHKVTPYVGVWIEIFRRATD